MGGRKRRDEEMYVPDTIQFDPSTDDDGDVDDMSELWASNAFVVNKELQQQGQGPVSAPHRPSFLSQKQQQSVTQPSVTPEDEEEKESRQDKNQGQGQGDDDDTTGSTVVRGLQETLRAKQENVAHLRKQLEEMRHSALGVQVVDGVTLFDDDDEEEDPVTTTDGESSSSEEQAKDKARAKLQDKKNNNSSDYSFTWGDYSEKDDAEGPPPSSFASIRRRIIKQTSSPRLQLNKGATTVLKKKRLKQQGNNTGRNITFTEHVVSDDSSSSSAEDEEEGAPDVHKKAGTSVVKLERRVAMAQARADSMIFEQEKKRQMQKELVERKAKLEEEHSVKVKDLGHIYETKLKNQGDELKRELTAAREQSQNRISDLEERLQHRTETINVLGESLSRLEEGMVDTKEELEWLNRVKDEQEKLIEQLTEQNEELQQRNEVLAAELAHLTDDGGLSKQALSGTRSHYEGLSLNLQSQLDEKDAQIESLTNMADKNKLSLQQFRRDMDRMSMAWQERLKTAERKHDALQEENREWSQANMSLKLQTTDFESRLGLSQKQREESNGVLSNRLRETEQKMIELQSILEQIQRTRAELEFTIQQKEEEQTKLESRCDVLDTQVHELTDQSNKGNKELKEAHVKMQLLKDAQAKNQTFQAAAQDSLQRKNQSLQEEAKVAEHRSQAQLDQVKATHTAKLEELNREISFREADITQLEQSAEQRQGKLNAMSAQYQKLVQAVRKRTSEQEHAKKQMELKLKEATQRADYLNSQMELLQQQQEKERDTESDHHYGNRTEIMSKLSDDDLESLLANVEGVLGMGEDRTTEFVLSETL
jgi:chromosome segregation ATPase